MSFSEQYAALEGKFKEQVEKDNEDLGIESCFLANIAPQCARRLRPCGDGTVTPREHRQH